MPAAGKLRNRIVLQQPGTARDAAGQPVAAWVDVATVWADILYTNGIEAIKGGAPISVARASLRIRYRSGITAGMRAVHGATVFDIKAVLPSEATRAFIDLAAETGANQG